MNLGFLLMLNCWIILAFFSFVLLFVLHIDAFQGGRVSRGNGLRKLVMMPTLLVQTSAEIPSGDEKEQFLKTLSTTVATGLKKPEDYVLVSLKKSDSIMFGGNSKDPAAFCYLASIGNIKPDINQRLAKSICDVLKNQLGVPQDRVYIQFFDSQVFFDHFYVYAV